MNLQRRLNSIVAFLAWIVGALLIVWLFIVARNAILNVIDAFYVGESVWRARQLDVFDKFYALIGSAVGVFLIGAGGAYFRQAGNEPDTLRRVALILGPELLVIASFHAILLAFQAGSGGQGQRFTYFGIELTIGLTCLVYALLARSKTHTEESSNS
mgnify:CR=1 FL=1